MFWVSPLFVGEGGGRPTKARSIGCRTYDSPPPSSSKPVAQPCRYDIPSDLIPSMFLTVHMYVALTRSPPAEGICVSLVPLLLPSPPLGGEKKTNPLNTHNLSKTSLSGMVCSAVLMPSPSKWTNITKTFICRESCHPSFRYCLVQLTRNFRELGRYVREFQYCVLCSVYSVLFPT